MPSKKSKPAATPRPPSWEEPACSERKLTQIAGEFAGSLKPGDRVLLEGVMGAGKSTFARALLLGLGVEQPPEGSPTFAIAHEYALPGGRHSEGQKPRVIHIDLYRIRSEAEIDEAGIPAYFWERDAIPLVEWSSLWPEFERSLLKHPTPEGSVWRVNLKIASETTRDLQILKIEQ